MEPQNPYKAPESAVADPLVDEGLADRGERLAAAIIDSLILIAVLLPVMIVGGYFGAAMDAARIGQRLPLGTQLLWAVISMGVFVAVQGYPLYTSAQSWGKRLLKLQIVGVDGERLPFARLISLRYLPFWLTGQVPIAGVIIAFVNPLLIFRKDRRCLHDLIAGTKVIKLR